MANVSASANRQMAAVSEEMRVLNGVVEAQRRRMDEAESRLAVNGAKLHADEQRAAATAKRVSEEAAGGVAARSQLASRVDALEAVAASGREQAGAGESAARRAAEGAAGALAAETSDLRRELAALRAELDAERDARRRAEAEADRAREAARAEGAAAQAEALASAQRRFAALEAALATVAPGGSGGGGSDEKDRLEWAKLQQAHGEQREAVERRVDTIAIEARELTRELGRRVDSSDRCVKELEARWAGSTNEALRSLHSSSERHKVREARRGGAKGGQRPLPSPLTPLTPPP